MNVFIKSHITSAIVFIVAVVSILYFVNIQAAPIRVRNFVVDYTIQSVWGGGATVNVVLKNKGPAVQGWNVRWAFPSNQTITSMWNATYIQNGASVIAKSLVYNASLPTNGVQSFGFNINYTGSNNAPTGFTVNSSTLYHFWPFRLGQYQ
jgi:hypothetical protein